MQLAMKFALELEAGMVHLNGPTVHDEATVPFGGVKDSGMGPEGGRWSIEEMTEVKWVTIQLGKRPVLSQPGCCRCDFSSSVIRPARSCMAAF